MEQELVEVGEGIKISRPVEVRKELKSIGKWFYISLSYKGILSIHSTTRDTDDYEYTPGDGINILQLTNLNNNNQVKIEAESESIVAFYDKRMILLTFNKPLREAEVKDVFRKIGKLDVFPYSDTGLVLVRRILYCTTIDRTPYKYNVDTKENTKFDIGHKIWSFGSLFGIDIDVQCVFQDDYDECTYVVRDDDNVEEIRGRERYNFTSIFASSSNSSDIEMGVLQYWSDLIKDDKKIEFSSPVKFYEDSIIRIYRDIFLLYDGNTKHWVLSRIIIS